MDEVMLDGRTSDQYLVNLAALVGWSVGQAKCLRMLVNGCVSGWLVMPAVGLLLGPWASAGWNVTANLVTLL